jgi:hypothetical protein
MSNELERLTSAFCDDSVLDYLRHKTQLPRGARLEFDEAYRLAHLPLVAPDHPLVIPAKPGSGYAMGQHDPVYSLGIPVLADQLFASGPFMELQAVLKSSRFSKKISWDGFDLRKHKLHATVCGALSSNNPPTIDQQTFERLAEIGPVHAEMRGIFSGNVNVGRLYLRLYPELRNGQNMCHEIQRICGRKTTNLYVVGIFNLIDELDLQETSALRKLIDHWWDRPLTRLSLDHLWLLKSQDDLVLNGSVAKTIPLV